jgi:hypothetical protein
VTFEIDSRGLGPSNGSLRVGFNNQFEREIDSFIEKLHQLRLEGPSLFQEMTILGVRPEMNRDQVEKIHGLPTLESSSYRPGYDHQSGEHFDLERINCIYGPIQVSYYQDDVEARVLFVSGPQIERDGIPLMFAGDKYSADGKLFEWHREDSTTRWETLPDADEWWRLEPGRGFFRLNNNREFEEFRLGQESYSRGKRVPPLC